MAIQIPSFQDVQGALLRLSHSQIQQLSTDSGVPFTTLWKCRNGPTENPGIETVRKFWPILEKLEAKA